MANNKTPISSKGTSPGTIDPSTTPAPQGVVPPAAPQGAIPPDTPQSAAPPAAPQGVVPPAAPQGAEVEPTTNKKKGPEREYKPGKINVDYGTQIEFMAQIIDDIISASNVGSSESDRKTKKRLLIGGDTGIGKTTFIKQFSKIIGVPSVIVEIPHIAEADIINMPFIKMPKPGEISGVGTDTFEKKGKSVRLVSAKSNLVSELETRHKIPDAQYPNWIQTELNQNDQELLKQFEEEYPGYIKMARDRVDNILFFDEYYRKTTQSIRNILRNVLDRHVGNDPLPRGTHVMYASNVTDVGDSMDIVSSHAAMNEITKPAPTKEQWLNHTISDAMHEGIRFKHDVVESFIKHMKDEHVSFNDVELDLRASPRRWSDILLYINNAYPFQDADRVGIIKSLLKRQFQSEGKTSELFDVVDGIVKDLAGKSNIPMKSIPEVPLSQWRDLLAHNVISQMQVGKKLKYVPVIEGPTGIGKTELGKLWEHPPYNLRFILYPANSLDTFSITGIPLPDEGNDDSDTMRTYSSEPPLYVELRSKMKEADKNYYEELKDRESSGQLGNRTADQEYQKFKNQKYQYLIMFDEINRVKTVDIFNSLRKLILEKEFNHSYKLPDEAIIIAAMNPENYDTQKMTKHFRDAINIIGSAPSWKSTVDYTEKIVIPKIQKSLKYPESIEVAWEVIKAITYHLHSDEDPRKLVGDREFHLRVGEGSLSPDLYVNPRDYTDLLIKMSEGVDRKLTALESKNIYDTTMVNNTVIKESITKMHQTFDPLIRNLGVGSADKFYEKIHKILSDTINIKLAKQSMNVGFDEILNSVLESNGQADATDINEFKGYLQRTAGNPAAMSKDIDDFFLTKFKYKDEDDIEEGVQKIDIMANFIGEIVNDPDESFDRDILNKFDESYTRFLIDLLSNTKTSNTEYIDKIVSLMDHLKKKWNLA